MSAVIGIALFVLAVLIFGVALIVARKPNAPSWLIEGFGGSLITITSIAFAVTGFGLAGQFVASYGREPLGAREIVLISISVMVLVVVLVGVFKALRRSTTVVVAPSTPVASAVTASTKEGDGSSTPVEPSGGRKRIGSKRAA